MKLAIRILVTAVIFVLIFRSIDIRQVAATVAEARFGLLAAAALLMFCATSLAAYRWHLIMNNLGLVRSLGFHWRSYLKGVFFNQGLPTSVGGDAIRVLDAAGRRYSKLEALYGVLLDRIAGVAALITLNLFAYAIYPDLLPDWVRSVVLVLAAGLVAAFVAGLNLRHLPWFESHPRLATLKILSERFHQAFAKDRFALVAASLVTHVFATFAVYAIGRSLGLTYEALTYFILVPPVLLLTVIPISLAGWGVREGAMVALFSFIGADKAPILAMSILYGLVLIVVSLPGFVIFLRGRTAATEPVIPSEGSDPRDPLKSESEPNPDHSPGK